MKDRDRKKPISYMKPDLHQWMTFIFFLFFFFDILSSSVTDDVSLGLSPPYCYRFVFYHRLLGPLVSVELWPVVVSAGQTHFGQN